jgi:photosystem II stability/assembly factor-like uncharacterized protein
VTIVAGALLLFVGAGAADGYSYPRFQPVSVAFSDTQHGVLGEDDWVCQKTHGCRGRLLVTTDGGRHWRVTATVARGVELFPVRGSRTVYALTGDAMLRTDDAGRHWRRAAWGPAIVSFVTPLRGWRLGRTTTLAHPPRLYQTVDGGRHWTRRVDPCSGDYGIPSALSLASAQRGWIVCSTQAATGFQGKEVWMTTDAGGRWTLEGRTHPIGPPKPKQQLGNISGYGYPTGGTFLANRHGWLMQARGSMLVTDDGGTTWRPSPLTHVDSVAAQSGDLLSDATGFILLRGCTVRLVRTDVAARTGTTLARWRSPTQC